MKITDLLTEAKKPAPPKTRSPAAASLADRKFQQKVIPNKKRKIDPKHKKAVGMDESSKPIDNFGIDDIKRLERVKDFDKMKLMAKELIATPSQKPMRPEKIAWFNQKIDSLKTPMHLIKLMYDLMLSGEGHSVIGTKTSMNPNSYRKSFGEEWETLIPGKRFGLDNPRILTVGDDPQGIYDFAITGNNVLSIRPFPAKQWDNYQRDARNKGYMLKYTGSDPKKAAIANPGDTPQTGRNIAGEKLPGSGLTPTQQAAVDMSKKVQKEASSPAQQAAIAVNMKKAGKKPKNESFDDGEPEGETMKNSLRTVIRVATYLDKRVDMNDEFPEWVSEKIGAVKSMMVNVMDYLISDQEMKTFESTKQKGVDGKACWKGYKRMGTKKKGGKTVDNCVPTGK